MVGGRTSDTFSSSARRDRVAPVHPSHTLRRLVTAILAVLAGLALTASGAQAASLSLSDVTVAELEQALTSGGVTCHAVVQGELDRISAYDRLGPQLNAVITVNPSALADADALDAKRASGAALGRAHCLPVVLKDNIETSQVRTTFGSSLFAGWTPAQDAPIVGKLRSQGAVVLAKGNLDDFAAAVYGESEITGVMRNPYDPSRTVGGSSGGPAASVSAGYAPLAFGTDTGGSLRIPAAFNSVVTIRPTTGLVSRSGMSPRALTQDTPGPLARTVADAAAGLDLVAGSDASDARTATANRHIPAAGYAAAATGGRLDGVRIGAIREGIALFGDPDDDVLALENQAISDLEALGATVVDLPQTFVDQLDRGFACNTCLLDSGVIGFESRRDLTAYLGSRRPAAPVTSFDQLYNGGNNAGRYTVHAKEGFDREATVDVSDPDTAANYQTLLERQGQLRAATLRQMSELDVDAVLYPSATEVPAPLQVEQGGVVTRWSEQTGFPSIGVPMGFGEPNDGSTTARLPANLEMLGGPWSESALIRIASAYEQATRRRVAPASTPATSIPLAAPTAPPPAPSPTTTPSPTSTPTPTPTVLAKVRVLRLDRQTLRTSRSRGVQVRLACTAACRVSVELRVTRATANRLRLRSIVVGRATITSSATGGAVRVRFSKTALARLPKSGRLALTVLAVGPAEARTTAGSTLR